MKKVIWLLLLASIGALGQTLSVSQSGTGNTATITVVSSNQFQLRWSAADNWGLDGWWDLVNDPGATTNLASPAYGVNGPSVPCGNQAGLANFVFYSEGDELAASHYNDVGCPFSSATRSATVILNTPSLVIIDTTSIPSINSRISSLLTVTTRYHVYPNGKIYVHSVINTSGAITLGAGAWGNDMAMEVSLPNSLQTGTAPPDSQSVGWVRATYNQNPYSYTNETSPFYWAYWGSSSGAYGFGSSLTPKASLMIVPSPNNTASVKQAIHSWGCGTGCGVTRLGWNVLNSQSLTAGQSVTYDWLVQLGTQGSSALPNMTVAPPSLCTTCSTIANAYIASPQPPSGGLLTGMTPSNKTIPSDWNLFASVDFESGTFGPSAYGNGNFVTDQAHTGAHSIECQVGGQPDCGGNVSWNRSLPVGTREVYLSWYEYLPASFRMNDEMFLARLHWDTGNGQPSFREAVFDYFQDSTLTYNSTDATLLWNIQGQPYYQNKLPTNTRGGNTNFTITTGSWVQHEIYGKFSTVASAVAVPGTVTLNASAKTYTCSACNWTTLGVHVGDSPHFTGFSTDANNGGGASGGGGTSYFVKSMTSTVLTMDDESMVSATNEGPVSGATVQIDRADGAYQYYKNGALVASQSAMVFPGKVDFSTQATSLSIGESYSKLIWHTGSETSAPFTSPCSTNISGTGYDNLAGLFGSGQYGWDASGNTATSQANQNAGIFTTPIRCSVAAGGPMPNPPVFKRYLDDIIVLTKPDVVTPPPTPTPLTISPTGWPFSSTGVNQPVSQVYTVTNPGPVPVTITQFSLTGSSFYQITVASNCGANVVVPAGSTCNFTIQFGTGLLGSYPANFSMTDSAGGSVAFSLSMNVTTTQSPPTISPTSAIVSLGKTQQFTTNFSSNQQWTTTIGTIGPTGSLVAPLTAGTGTVTIKDGFNRTATASVTVVSTLTVAPASFNFGASLVNSLITAQFSVRNLNSVPLSLAALSTSGAPFTTNSTLSTCQVNMVLQPQTGCTWTINFLPTSATSYSGTATLRDSAAGQVVLPLSGLGQVPSAVNVSPTSYAWGNIKTGTTSNATFTVSNPGVVPVTVSALTVTGTGFSAGTSSCFNGIILNPQASCTFVVTFAPVSAIAYSGNLAVVDNSPNTTNAALSGTGTTPPATTAFKFRNIKLKGVTLR